MFLIMIILLVRHENCPEANLHVTKENKKNWNTVKSNLQHGMIHPICIIICALVCLDGGPGWRRAPISHVEFKKCQRHMPLSVINHMSSVKSKI